MRNRYTRRAIRHLAALRRFSTDRFGTATTKATLERIEATIDALADNPGRGRPGGIAGTSELVVPGLPLIVAYRTTTNAIDGLAILHGVQRWPDKLA